MQTVPAEATYGSAQSHRVHGRLHPYLIMLGCLHHIHLSMQETDRHICRVSHLPTAPIPKHPPALTPAPNPAPTLQYGALLRHRVHALVKVGQLLQEGGQGLAPEGGRLGEGAGLRRSLG